MPGRPIGMASRSRYDSRRADVVLDAARLFARRGYDQTSVTELARELKVSTGSLYHYFRSKEELLIAICDQLMGPLLEDAAELVTDHVKAADQLRAVVALWVEHVVTHREHLLVFQQERHVIDHGEQWRGIREDRKRFERLIEGILKQLHDEGGARLGTPRLSLAALLGMVNHTAQWYRPRGILTPHEIAAGYSDLLIAD